MFFVHELETGTRELEVNVASGVVKKCSSLFAAGKLVYSWALLIGSEDLFCLICPPLIFNLSFEYVA